MASRSSIELARTALVLVVILAAGAARAGEPDADADALIHRGVALRREGRDAEALEAFERALARSATPRARAQVALAEQALALWLAAERALLLALAEKDDPWIRQNREALERAAVVVAGKLAWITIESSNTSRRDAQVFVNGALATPAPDGRIRVVAGQVAIELRLANHAPANRTVHVAPETTVKVALDVGPRIAVPSTGTPTLRPPAPEDSSSSGSRTLGWVLTGAGVASLGVGGFFGVRAITKKDERASECEGGCTQAGVDADRAGRTAALVSTITVAAGVVATSVGVFFVVTSRSPSGSAAQRPGLSVGVSGASLDLRGSF
jgi:hypothetical protein